MISVLSTFIISRYNPTTFLNLELQCVLISIVVYIKNRVAFCLDDNILIKLFQMKSCVSYVRPLVTVSSLHLSIRIISGSLLSHSIDNTVNIASFRNGLYKIITIASQILFPDNNRIRCCCIRNPTSIYCNLICQSLVKVILCATGSLVSDCFILKPTAEGIAVTDHISIIRSGRLLTGIYELRSVISSSFAVLIKDKPMSFRSKYAELNITGDRYGLIVLILRPFSVTNNVASALMDIPTFKMIILILNRISHIYFIALLISRRVSAECHFFLAKRDTVFIQVGNTIILEQHRIVGHFFSIMCRRKHPCNICTDLSDRLCRCRRSIVRIRCPSAEIDTVCQCPSTRIIQDLLHIVAALDVHGSNLCTVKANEVHKKSCILSLVYHHIHREMFGFESDRPVDRHDVFCDQLAVAFLIDVVDTDLADVQEAFISNSDQHRLLRLPTLAIFV